MRFEPRAQSSKISSESSPSVMISCMVSISFSSYANVSLSLAITVFSASAVIDACAVDAHVSGSSRALRMQSGMWRS